MIREVLEFKARLDHAKARARGLLDQLVDLGLRKLETWETEIDAELRGWSKKDPGPASDEERTRHDRGRGGS